MLLNYKSMMVLYERHMYRNYWKYVKRAIMIFRTLETW